MPSRQRIAALLLLAFTLRAGYGILIHRQPLVPDAGGYDAVAWTLATEGRIALPHGALTAYRPPAYILFMAGIYKLAGHHYGAVRLAQAALGSLLVLVLMRLTHLLGSDPRSVWKTGLIAALYPFFIYYDNDLIADSFMTFWLVLSLWLFLEWRQKPASWSLAVKTAISFAVLCLTKTLFIPFFALLIVIEALSAMRKPETLPRWGRLGVMGVVCAIPIVVWGMRNERLFGRFLLDTHGGATSVECVMFYTECKQGIFPQFFQNHPLRQAADGMNEAEVDHYYRQLTRRWIEEHPQRFFRQALGNLKNFWRFYPRQDLTYHEGRLTLTVVSLLTEPFLIFMGFAGFFKSRRQWHRWYPIPILFMMLTMVHALLTGQMRYRLPLMPFLIAFSTRVL